MAAMQRLAAWWMPPYLPPRKTQASWLCVVASSQATSSRRHLPPAGRSSSRPTTSSVLWRIAASSRTTAMSQPVRKRWTRRLRPTTRRASPCAMWHAWWPTTRPGRAWRSAMPNWPLYLAARQLAADILAALGRGLDVEPGFFEQRHTGQNQTLRYLHYPASGAGSALPAGAGAHTDHGSITLLWQDGQAGLEVRDAQGRWLPVSSDPSQVVVNIGDLLQCWTAGRCQSTLHRVRQAQTGQPRYSIAFFATPTTRC